MPLKLKLLLKSLYRGNITTSLAHLSTNYNIGCWFNEEYFCQTINSQFHSLTSVRFKIQQRFKSRIAISIKYDHFRSNFDLFRLKDRFKDRKSQLNDWKSQLNDQKVDLYQKSQFLSKKSIEFDLFQLFFNINKNLQDK